MAEALAFEVMLLLFEIASVATLYCTCFSEVVSCLECTVELRRMQGWPGCRLDCDCRCWSTYSTVQYSTYPRHRRFMPPQSLFSAAACAWPPDTRPRPVLSK
ncbi:hypothetical protein BKA61DRAFT_115314 [Leptodontidium sp. MPI-SDFR-AT-0119]|nr:hypothetical protein BKA61DRAFT_115314 [Leptodontidium sp. MPI-SDFR-AT-0119]